MIAKQKSNVIPSIELIGLKPLLRTLESLPDKMRNRVVPPALRASGKPMVKDARTRLGPTKVGRYGVLKKSLGTKLVRKRRKDSKNLLVLGPRSGEAYTWWSEEGVKIVPSNYAHLVEFGTKPHAIPGPVKIGKTGTVVENVQHPGARPRPFMRPAFDTGKGRSITAFARAARKALDREAARAAKAIGKLTG